MKTISLALASVSVLALAGCETVPETTETEDAVVTAETAPDDVIEVVETEVEKLVAETVDMPSNAELLQAVLDAQPEVCRPVLVHAIQPKRLPFSGLSPEWWSLKPCQVGDGIPKS